MCLPICGETTCFMVRLRGQGECLPRCSAVDDGTVGKDGAQFLALEELQQTLLGPVGSLDALAAGVFVFLAQTEMDTSARDQGVLRLV